MDKSGKILIVDDETMVTRTLSMLLGLEGFSSVVLFNNPNEALEYLNGNEVDLIISDFIMPEMNGIEFLENAKKTQENVTTILLTGYADKENAIRAMNSTVYDPQNQKVTLQVLLGKPIVINYWATWCGYCVEEMPTFEKVYQEEKDNVVFMMINATDGVSETVEKAQKFIEEKGFQFPVYYDINGEVGYQYGIYSLPTTIFIHKDGTIEIGYKGMLPENVLRQENQKIKE